MTYDKVIELIMPEVESGSDEPFIIYRDNNGAWQYSFTQNQYGDKYDWLEDIQDPFAATTTGSELANGSFPNVYDSIFNQRLRLEYEKAFFPNTDPDELKALINLFEDHINYISADVTDYLALFDRPLAALYEMTPISLKSKDNDFKYNLEKADEFVKTIETVVHDRIHNRKKLDIQDDLSHKSTAEKFGKRIIDGYEELNAVQLNGWIIFIGENQSNKYPYMHGEFKQDSFLGILTCQSMGFTHDYVWALDKFNESINNNLNAVKTNIINRKNLHGVEPITLTTDNCIPNALDESIDGKLIIINPEVLSRELRSADYQLRVCTGGFGSSPKSFGTAVFCTDLIDGKNSRFEKYDVLGVADLEKLPKWAVDKFTEYQAKQNDTEINAVSGEKTAAEKSVETPTPKKKPSLQEKLDSAKKKATQKETSKNKSAGNKSKKRSNKEIE